MKTSSAIAFVAAVLCAMPGCAAEAPPQAAPGLDKAVSQLRHAVGKWNVVTEFLNPDATVAAAVEGTYEFEWVVPDRVLRGQSNQPESGQSAAILFYVREKERQIEMVSVGADGRLWVMSGAFDSETRMTPPFEQSDGSTGQLRFTRYNVQPDRFESRMEYSTDGGAIWSPGNHQVFVRAPSGSETNE